MSKQGDKPTQQQQHQLRSQQLATDAEIAAARAYLEVQGNATSLITTPTADNCQYIASTKLDGATQQQQQQCLSTAAASLPGVGSTATEGRCNQPQQQDSSSELVVPICARSSQLNMVTMAQLIQGAAALATQSCSAALSGEAADCSAAAGHVGGNMAEAGVVGFDDVSGGHAVSLAIVDGVDVVQVKLFAGIQAPAESY